MFVKSNQILIKTWAPQVKQNKTMSWSRTIAMIIAGESLMQVVDAPVPRDDCNSTGTDKEKQVLYIKLILYTLD